MPKINGAASTWEVVHHFVAWITARRDACCRRCVNGKMWLAQLRRGANLFFAIWDEELEAWDFGVGVLVTSAFLSESNEAPKLFLLIDFNPPRSQIGLAFFGHLQLYDMKLATPEPGVVRLWLLACQFFITLSAWKTQMPQEMMKIVMICWCLLMLRLSGNTRCRNSLWAGT